MQILANLDLSVFYSLNNIAGWSPFVRLIIVFFAVYLAFILPIALLILILRESSSWSEKIHKSGIILLSAGVSRGVATVIRFFYHRPRPFLSHEVYQLFPESSYSFPSGHSTFFFAFAFAIYLYNKKWGIWFLIATIFITIARVMAGVHYPSDILSGAIIGFVTAFLAVKYLSSPLKRLINKFL